MPPKFPTYSFTFKKSPNRSLPVHFTKILLHAVTQYLSLEERHFQQQQQQSSSAAPLSPPPASTTTTTSGSTPWNPPFQNHTLSCGTKIYNSTQQCIILYDAYPKARYHLLVVPRNTNLLSLNHLTRDDLPLLRHMLTVAQETVQHMIPSSCQDSTPNTVPEFRFGYHAIPSLQLLHMHVISQDFISPCLKNKKHWNSFNTEFFLDASEVIDKIEKDGKFGGLDSAEYKAMEKRDLQCDGITFRNMPKLRQYLLQRDAMDDKV